MATERAVDAPRDDEMEQIVAEEQRVLARVVKHLAGRKLSRGAKIDYDEDLVALRDEIGEARLEDVPALVAQMERLQQVASRRADVTEGHVDARSPYFGRIVLQEGVRKREVLIGRATYLDSRTGVQIVDWRDAPVSRVYYRYEEGDDYDEKFGDRYVEGEVLTRRSLSISQATLRRIAAPQGTFMRRGDGQWARAGESATQLKGGQGLAPRPQHYDPVGKLGIALEGEGREDKHLPEIAALIDSRQFELITMPDAGLVVIQGGVGSGKTTIGLHRLAYLAFQDKRRFRPERMLVVVFNDALARYIGHVLPALGVEGVPVVTYHAWASKQRAHLLPGLPKHYTDETPDVVVRLKKHPAWLKILDAHVQALEQKFEQRLQQAIVQAEDLEETFEAWGKNRGRALAQRLSRLLRWAGGADAAIAVSSRHVIEREVSRLREDIDVAEVWSELLTDRDALFRGFAQHAPGEFTEGQISAVVRWCGAHCALALAEAEERAERKERQRNNELEMDVGIDGERERVLPELDWEDDALLLRIYQRLRGPIKRGKEPLRYEHMFVDETQDLSPLELGVLLGTVRSESVTLAGDTAQRLMMDNGFSDWRKVMSDLGMSHVEIEPLRIAYRSTHQIMDFANEVLGPLRNPEDTHTTRHGVPVEMFSFGHTGDAVGFLAENLRTLVQSEPLASVAVIARTPEQAREYADGLVNAEVPRVRLVADQDFAFKAGVDVTDVRQVKGLEFDYVVLVEVTAESYPVRDEARHLLHIAATRAAHQLWVLTTDQASSLLPQELRQRGY